MNDKNVEKFLMKKKQNLYDCKSQHGRIKTKQTTTTSKITANAENVLLITIRRR